MLDKHIELFLGLCVRICFKIMLTLAKILCISIYCTMYLLEWIINVYFLNIWLFSGTWHNLTYSLKILSPKYIYIYTYIFLFIVLFQCLLNISKYLFINQLNLLYDWIFFSCSYFSFQVEFVVLLSKTGFIVHPPSLSLLYLNFLRSPQILLCTSQSSLLSIPITKGCLGLGSHYMFFKGLLDTLPYHYTIHPSIHPQYYYLNKPKMLFRSCNYSM